MKREGDTLTISGAPSKAQNRWLAQAAGVGIAAGLILFPLLGFPLARNLALRLASGHACRLGYRRRSLARGHGHDGGGRPQKWDAIIDGSRRAALVGLCRDGGRSWAAGTHSKLGR